MKLCTHSPRALHFGVLARLIPFSHRLLELWYGSGKAAYPTVVHYLHRNFSPPYRSSKSLCENCVTRQGIEPQQRETTSIVKKHKNHKLPLSLLGNEQREAMFIYFVYSGNKTRAKVPSESRGKSEQIFRDNETIMTEVGRLCFSSFLFMRCKINEERLFCWNNWPPGISSGRPFASYKFEMKTHHHLHNSEKLSRLSPAADLVTKHSKITLLCKQRYKFPCHKLAFA